MRFFDENNNEMKESEIDLNLGHLRPDVIKTVFREAVNAEPEIWHYETVRSFPNGGREVVKIVDKPGTTGASARWETEEIMRYVLYSDEEKAKRALVETREDLLDAFEELLSATSASGLITTLIDLKNRLGPVLKKREEAREKLGRKKDR